MTKEKLYDPETKGTFRMMFGFNMANIYKINRNYKYIKGIKQTDKNDTIKKRRTTEPHS
tara:strand:+ start:156 stop:332 length:177 start_codon:yes stop_codon:yes gene_type:complete